MQIYQILVTSVLYDLVFFLFAPSLILDRDRRNAVHGTRAQLLRLDFDVNLEFGLGKGHIFITDREGK